MMRKELLRIGVTTVRGKTEEYVSWLTSAETEHIHIDCIELSHPQSAGSEEQENESIARNLALLPTLDAIVFTGGLDVEPHRFNRQDPPEALRELDVETDPIRDRAEWPLATYALDHHLPILGICRGLQLINVVMGGTLFLDIEKEGATAVTHKKISNTESGIHPIRLDPDSNLYQWIGQEHEEYISTRHHQAIRDVAPGLRAVGFSPDGIIEAVEAASKDKEIWLVQWHPERMWLERTRDARLDNAFSKDLLIGFIQRLASKKASAAPSILTS